MSDDDYYFPSDETPRRKLKRLRIARGKLFDRTRDLALKSVEEERHLSAEEASEYNAGMASIAELSAQIAPLEEAAQVCCCIDGSASMAFPPVNNWRGRLRPRVPVVVFHDESRTPLPAPKRSRDCDKVPDVPNRRSGRVPRRIGVTTFAREANRAEEIISRSTHGIPSSQNQRTPRPTKTPRGVNKRIDHHRGNREAQPDSVGA